MGEVSDFRFCTQVDDSKLALTRQLKPLTERVTVSLQFRAVANIVSGVVRYVMFDMQIKVMSTALHLLLL